MDLATRVLWATVAVTPGCVIQVHEAQETTQVTEPYSAVRLDIEAGAVEFAPSTDGSTTVLREAEWTGSPPQMQLYVQDGVLYASSTCAPAEWVCSTRHIFTLPPEVQIGGAVSAGGLFAEDLSGDVDVDVGSGGVVLARMQGDIGAVVGSGGFVGEALGGALDLAVGSGGVVLDGVSGPVLLDVSSGGFDGEALTSPTLEATLGSGGFEAEWDTAPERVWVEVGSGGIDVEVPAGAYNLTIQSGDGVQEVEGLTHDPDSTREITLIAGSGGIELSGR